MQQGNREDAVVFANDASHFCRYNIAGWLELGFNNLSTILTDGRNAIDVDAFKS